MQVHRVLRSLVRDYTMQTPLTLTDCPKLFAAAQVAMETCARPEHAWAAVQSPAVCVA